MILTVSSDPLNEGNSFPLRKPPSINDVLIIGCSKRPWSIVMEYDVEHISHLYPTGSNLPADRLINAKQLRHRVLFSQQHINRLEADGLFPKRIRLGPARVAWSSNEITAWMQAKIDARGPCPFAGVVPALDAQDRFVGKKELRELVVYSPQHIRLLELEYQFPLRVWIGQNRVAWLERDILSWREIKRTRR